MSALLAAIVWFCLGIQAFHYLGYPALIAVIAKLRPRPVNKAAIKPRVSLIISAYNEEKVIGEKLDNSLALDWPGLEIIVNSEGSTDDTAEIVAAYEQHGIIGIAGAERRGKAQALAVATARAGGEILVFSDANAFYDRQAIRAL
ncbi:MAG: glycosyltransferase, partial [Geminicoccaceae bacterium]